MIKQEKEIELIESNCELTIGKIVSYSKGGKSPRRFKYEYVFDGNIYFDEFSGTTLYPENYLNKKYPVKVYADDYSKSIIVIDTLDSISQY